MANKRLFYGVYQAGFSEVGENDFTEVHGLQSMGIDTRFNLEQVFEIGQVALYENIENIPDIEVTMEKVLDGYPLIYHLATTGATSATLSGRSNIKSTIGMSVFSDDQDAASGTPLTQCTISGVFPSQLSYRIQVDGNATESVTLVGNNKVWATSGFTFTGQFDNTDAPFAAEGVNRREDILFGSAQSLLPQDIPGITSSGTNELTLGEYGAHLQSIAVSTNLGRDQLFELGRRGPYHRYVSFPVEVTCEIECYTTRGDLVTALEDATSNLTDRTIKVVMREGTTLDLGTRNKLASVTFGGANAGQQGGNATVQYSYSNFNSLTISHPEDPSGL